MSGLLNNSLFLSTAAAAGGYQVSRSLRFNAPDTAFLNRTPAVAGNRKTWTWAGWVKRCQFGTYEHIFNGTGSSPSYAQFYWSPTEQLVFDNGGSGAITTTQVFRDPSAWYHIVLTFDTTQGTAADRMRMYANGQQITTFSSSSYPTQNSDGGMNQASAHFIGKESSFAGFYLADIHFIDGQALTPSSFTEVSATTGQLIPKAYSGGSYGTNGFYLKFDDNSSNTATTLGKDSSGNGNNWTPNNFSVVAGGPTTITTPASNSPPTVDYLVVAGGGGGSNGGGGAGGLRSTVTATGGGGALETALTLTAATSYTVTVGAGGAGGVTTSTAGSNGSNSVFSTITSVGGGGGGTQTSGSAQNGGNGGSGGGTGYGRPGPSGTVGTGTSGQGFAGGQSYSDQSTFTSGGSGGGASAVGGSVDVPSGNCTPGGAGVAVSITGSSVTYAGGGGGAGGNGKTQGVGGAGGGGTGVYSGTANAGTPNLGGGGGGANEGTGGAGGSGVVILRYPNTYADLTVGSGLTYTYANTGGYKIYSFTASATPAQAAGNDSLVDTPTSISATDTGVGGEIRGNYATLNPLQKGSDLTLSNGNLDLAKSSTVDNCTASTIGMTSGKWYFELTITNLGGGEYAIGFGKNIPIQSYMGSNATTWSYADTGSLMTNGNTTSYGSSYTTGDILGAAFDGDNGTLTFYKNGTSQGTAATGLTQGPYFFAAGAYNSAATRSANFGQRAFAYPVSGFKALCDTNLGAPVVAKPDQAFGVLTYSGNGSARTLTGLNQNPDLIWIKSRSAAQKHVLVDSVRTTATGEYLASDSTQAEGTGVHISGTTNGITIAEPNASTIWYNDSSNTYVAWCWDAGTTTASNPDGSITSQVRANVSAGFSVVTYTGNGNDYPTGATVGHGLGVAPEWVIVKSRGTAGTNWAVWHSKLTAADYTVLLNDTGAQASGSNAFNRTLPTSTVFSVGQSAGGTRTNESGVSHVAYCFAPVVGYSSFGSYTGNGSADGPFVYTGFRPRYVLQKKTSDVSAWAIRDAARDPYNAATARLWTNFSSAESSADAIDLLSNGFKVRNTDTDWNANGATYIYYAVAENPFQYARAR